MSRFFQLYERWEHAETAAWRAESDLSHRLDAYCEGTGSAPGLDEVAQVKRLRDLARDACRAIAAHFEDERQERRVL